MSSIYSPLFAIFFVFLIYSIGDFIASRTKAFLSMFLVAAILFTIAFWCGMPKTLFADAGLISFCKITIIMCMIHIGSSIDLNDFLKEWRTVIIAFLVTVAVCFGVYFVGRLIIDPNYALMSAPIMAGATISYLIMQPMADILGRPDIAIFGILVLVTQNFVGIPLASYCCRKSGDKYLEDWRNGITAAQESEGKKLDLQFIHIPKSITSNNMIICRLALVAWLCSELSKVIGINGMIIGLLAGVFCHAIGFIEDNPLVKANGFTFVIAAVLALIFSGLGQTSPQMLLSMLAPLVVVLALGVILCIIFAAIIGKLVGFSPKLAIGLASACFFGFPGTYLIAEEVSNACSKTDEEHKAIWKFLMPKLIISGVVSVSVVSGLIASIMVTWVG